MAIENTDRWRQHVCGYYRHRLVGGRSHSEYNSSLERTPRAQPHSCMHAAQSTLFGNICQSMNMFVLPVSLYLTCTGDYNFAGREKGIVGSAVVVIL